jgi:hypothetical protein
MKKNIVKESIDPTYFHDIYRLISDELYEGLIKTNEIKLIDKILLKQYSDIRFLYDENYFIITFKFNKNIDIAEDELDRMLQVTSNLGWFPSQIVSSNRSLKFSRANFSKLISSKDIELHIAFEAIYDNPVSIPDTLYHVTKLKYVHKILNVDGLIPKKQEKLTAHPDRVYFTKSMNDALFFVHQILLRMPVSEEEPLSILKVDTHDIKNQMRLFKDPNFKNGKDCIGFYTLNNIHLKHISLIKTIYP